MRITVEIDAEDLAIIQKATGIHKRSLAIQQALRSYLHGLERRRFLRQILEGKSDYSRTNEELETLGASGSD